MESIDLTSLLQLMSQNVSKPINTLAIRGISDPSGGIYIEFSNTDANCFDLTLGTGKKLSISSTDSINSGPQVDCKTLSGNIDTTSNQIYCEFTVIPISRSSSQPTTIKISNFIGISQGTAISFTIAGIQNPSMTTGTCRVSMYTTSFAGGDTVILNTGYADFSYKAATSLSTCLS